MSQLFRQALKGAIAALTVSFALTASAAEDIKFMVAGTPGGGFDQAARALGKAMQETGQAKGAAFDYKPGAGGSIGLAQFVNASKGDPNALIVASCNTVTGFLQNKSPITLANATPVARLFTEFNVIAVNKTSPYKTLGELIADMKKNPTSIKWAGGSKGSVDHIGVIEIAQAVGIPSGQVNYSPIGGGGETVAAALGGHVTALSAGYPEIAKYVESGQMRLLAIASPTRVPGVEVATLKEQGVDVVTGNWRIFYAPPGITPAQQASLVSAVLKATEAPTWQSSLKKNLWTPTVMTGAELENFVKTDTARLERALKEVGLL